MDCSSAAISSFVCRASDTTRRKMNLLEALSGAVIPRTLMSSKFWATQRKSNQLAVPFVTRHRFLSASQESRPIAWKQCDVIVYQSHRALSDQLEAWRLLRHKISRVKKFFWPMRMLGDTTDSLFEHRIDQWGHRLDCLKEILDRRHLLIGRRILLRPSIKETQWSHVL